MFSSQNGLIYRINQCFHWIYIVVHSYSWYSDTIFHQRNNHVKNTKSILVANLWVEEMVLHAISEIQFPCCQLWNWERFVRLRHPLLQIIYLLSHYFSSSIPSYDLTVAFSSYLVKWAGASSLNSEGAVTIKMSPVKIIIIKKKFKSPKWPKPEQSTK